MKVNSPLVSVILITYNQESFIAQAIDSVLTQQCDFEYEVIIGDDCSSDNTPAIVEEYAKNHHQIRCLKDKYNLGPLKNEQRCIEASRGKYIAFLEGDDFWSNDLKLQKQVLFLEANPDYGLVHGDVNHLYADSGKLMKNYNRSRAIEISEEDNFGKLLFEPHYYKTMTVCFKKDLLEKYFDYDLAVARQWRLTDLPIWLIFAHLSKVKYLDEVLSTYRLSEESSSRTKNTTKAYEFHSSVFDIKRYYCRKFGYTDFLHRVNVSAEQTLILDSYQMKNGRLGFKHYMKLIRVTKQVSLRYLIITLLTISKSIFSTPQSPVIPEQWEN